MSTFSFGSITTALKDALKALPNWSDLLPTQKGKVIDDVFKKMLKDLMDQFGMKPGEDYVDNLKENEPCTDFVALSSRADDILTGLLEGKILAISAYSKKKASGEIYEVKAHFRRKAA